MELMLAILPSVLLLVYIYKNDKKDKEPMKLLIKLFCFGMISTAAASTAETVLDAIVEVITVRGSVAFAFLEAFLVAGLCEEVVKYVALNRTTWKNRNFNCAFDGIIYSTYVSLGFATLENLMYVSDGGISTAIARMFSSVPGHTCFGVFMGFFYSKARIAESNGNYLQSKKYKKMALIVPIILHGIYDSLLMVEEGVVGEMTVIISILMWYGFVALLFITSFIMVKILSKKDYYFAPSLNLDLYGRK